jgi:ABC-type molybdate transport system substrate-binding protein
VLLGAVVAVAVAAAAFTGWKLLGPAAPPTTVPGKASAPVSCADPASVTVAAAPAVAPILGALANQLSTHEDGPCAAFTIQSAEAYAVSGTVGTSAAPDAWITDSPDWVARAQLISGRQLTAPAPFASTGLVVALPRELAEKIGDETTWSDVVTGGTPVRIPDPNRSTLGTSALGAATPGLSADAVANLVRSNATTPTPDLAAVAGSEAPVGVVAPAAQLVAFNESAAGQSLAAVGPVDGAAYLGYSLVTLTEEAEVAGLVAELAAYLATDEAKESLADAGFTTPDGPDPETPSPLYGVIVGRPASDPASLNGIRTQWNSVAPRAQAILGLDVSGSLLRRTDAGTRLEVMQAAVTQAASGMAPASNLALWAYSQHIGTKGDDFRVLANAGLVSDAKHFAEIRKQVAGLNRHVGGGSGLYDTIEAAYRKALATYAKGYNNTVVIVTDGPNEDDYGASLEILTERLKGLRDPARPITVVLIGMGTEADAKALSSIVKLTGGRYVAAPEPADLLPALRAGLGG